MTAAAAALSLGQAVREAARELAAADLPSPDLDARVLAAHAAGLDAAGLIVASRDPAGTVADVLRGYVARRIAGEPAARILGRREFWGMDFAVSPETLVPRPDSETVVEAALAMIDAGPGRGAALRVADLGTGTGCLLIALLSELPAATGIGVDISPGAVATARANAAANGLESRATFTAGSWTGPLDGGFDAILSNPPYISTGDIAGLAADVRDHDPLAALDGGGDGLDAYRALLPGAVAALRPAGFAVLEVGVGMANDVADIAVRAGLTVLSARCDLEGRDRAVIAVKDDENCAVQKPLGKDWRTG